MRRKHHYGIRDAFEDSLAGLVEFYTQSEPIIERGVMGGKWEMAAVVGFGADSLRGSSILLGNPNDLRLLSTTPVHDPLDYLGELNNQTVGRMRNKLARCNLRVQIGTPITLSGQGLALGIVDGSSSNWEVRWPGGKLFASLAICVAPDLRITDTNTIETIEEGSITLF